LASRRASDAREGRRLVARIGLTFPGERTLVYRERHDAR
jgi:hypothetical protein